MTIEAEHADRERRAGRNQSLFREVNERVEEINQANDLWLTLAEWVCECAFDTCTERVELTPEQYEKVREEPTRFLVAPSSEHVIPDVEEVVERHSRYWVVEKAGEAATVAEQLDARSEGASPNSPNP
jgi:hypothetical protein